MKPLYLNTNLEQIIKISDELYEKLKKCDLCPRNCLINRIKGEIGYCGGRIKAKISSYFAHFGEESFISGENGSGTVFFCGCNLKCVFCQNYEISCLDDGYELDDKELACIFLKLQSMGCHNINLVTPTHFVPQILKALVLAIKQGLEIPIIYNCGGYESLNVIQKLKGIIDIYMPDVKFYSPEKSKRYLNTSDYFNNIKDILKEMHKQVDILKVENGIAKKGLLIRHLVMPDCIDELENILKFISTHISPQTYINIMPQYKPLWKAENYTEINRKIYLNEFKKAIHLAKKYLTNVYF